MLQIWCLDNDGAWDGEDSFCGFKTQVQSMKANANLDDIRDGPDNLPDKYNQAICDIMEIKCPDNPDFNASYSMELGRTYVNQYKYETQYTFYYDYTDPNDLTYRICETENSDKYYDDCQWQHRYLDGR